MPMLNMATTFSIPLCLFVFPGAVKERLPGSAVLRRGADADDVHAIRWMEVWTGQLTANIELLNNNREVLASSVSSSLVNGTKYVKILSQPHLTKCIIWYFHFYCDRSTITTENRCFMNHSLNPIRFFGLEYAETKVILCFMFLDGEHWFLV